MNHRGRVFGRERLFIAFLLAACSGAPAAEPQIAPRSPCDAIEASAARAAKIRGLRFKDAVPCDVRAAADIRRYVIEQLVESGGKARLDQESAVYKLLGLLREDFDYVAELISMYSGQIGGYYDPDTKRFAIAEALPARMNDVIAVHELTHALQDQHFRIGSWLHDHVSASDTLLARAALVEGDATWVMLGGRDDALSSEYPEERQAVSVPLRSEDVLRRLIAFPYVAGGVFVSELRKVGGQDAVDRAFANPPLTTAEVLHPERYFERIRTGRGARPDPYEADPKSGRLFSDTLGEIVLQLVLATELPLERAQSIASAWRGDRATLCGKGARRTLVWRIDASDRAAELAQALREVFMADAPLNPSRRERRGASRPAAEVRIEGADVVLVLSKGRRARCDAH